MTNRLALQAQVFRLRSRSEKSAALNFRLAAATFHGRVDAGWGIYRANSQPGVCRDGSKTGGSARDPYEIRSRRARHFGQSRERPGSYRVSHSPTLYFNCLASQTSTRVYRPVRRGNGWREMNCRQFLTPPWILCRAQRRLRGKCGTSRNIWPCECLLSVPHRQRLQRFPRLF